MKKFNDYKRKYQVFHALERLSTYYTYNNVLRIAKKFESTVKVVESKKPTSLKLNFN